MSLTFDHSIFYLFIHLITIYIYYDANDYLIEKKFNDMKNIRS